jgi:hypothetical protein
MRKPTLVVLSLALGLGAAAVLPAAAEAAPAAHRPAASHRPTASRASAGRTATLWRGGANERNEGRRPVTRPFVLPGTVAAVDPDAGTLGVTSGSSTRTLSVGATARVTVDGASAALADVPVGARVVVAGTTSSDATTVSRVAAITTWTFRLQGLVDAADADAGTLTVLTDGQEYVSVPVDPAATVTVDGAAATLADLPAGARVRLGGTVTDGVADATAVSAVTHWTFSTEGTLDSVDTDDTTVTVSGRDGSVTVPVDPAAVIRQNGQTVALSALTAGSRVRVAGTVTNSAQLATRVDATTPHRSGRR